MSGQSMLFDGIGFYIHPIAKEHIINSPIGKEIMGIIYPLPSLDQVQIIIIPFIPFSEPISKGLIPLDPNFVWLDPDTLDDIGSWTPELLVRYFEDTIRQGEVIEGRKVVVSHGWVEECLKAGRVLGSEDDWAGWRVRGSYDICNNPTTSSHYRHSQIVPNPSNPSIQTIPLSHNIPQPYSDDEFTNDSVISSVPHRSPPTSNGSNGSSHASKSVTYPQSLPSSHPHPVHDASSYIHPSSEASSNHPNFFDCHNTYHSIQSSHLSRPAFHVVRHSGPYLQQTDTSESQPPVPQPILSRALPSGANIPIPELIASGTAKDYTTHQSNFKEYLKSQPRYHPKERYDLYPTPSGVSPTHERARPLQDLLTLDKPLHPRKRGNETPIIVPSQKIIQAGYVPPTPISPVTPVTWNRTSNPPLSGRLSIQANHLSSAIQRQNRVKSSSSNAILQPTMLVGLSNPTWWDVNTSRTINISNTPTKWQMTMNQKGNVERREANISGTVTSVNVHTQAQRKISKKENEMSKRPEHFLDTHAVLPTQPCRGEKSSSTTCQAQTEPIFIDSHGKPMKMYLAPNIHPIYQEKIKTEGGQLCSRLHASIAIFYRTATDPSPLMPKSTAENEAGWNCGKKGQGTVTLEWLKVCLEKRKLVDTKEYQIVFQKPTRNDSGTVSGYTTLSSKKRKVVPFTAHSQVTVPSSRKPITDFSSQAESAATSRAKSTSILSQSSSFPSCPSLTEYDPISWQVEKIARRLYQNGKTGRLATLSDPDANGSGKDFGTDNYLEKYDLIIQDRVKELANQFERAGGTVQNNETKNVPVSISSTVSIPSISNSDSSSMSKSRTEVQMKPGIANLQDHAFDSGELQMTSSLVSRLLTQLETEGHGMANDNDDGSDSKMEAGDGNEDEEMRNLMDEELKGLDEFFNFGGDTPKTGETSTPTDRLETKAETTSSGSLSMKRVLVSEDIYDAGVDSQMVEPASQPDNSVGYINVDVQICKGKDEGEELEDELDQYHLFFQSLLDGSCSLSTPTKDPDASRSIGEVGSKDNMLVDSEDSEEEIPLRVVQASRVGARE